MFSMEYFERGREYQRVKIHDKYGGQRQGGISTPSKYPIILLFDTKSGSEYGYRDGFTKEGIFEWTGEGQTGIMKMTGGNKAILNHQKEGEQLHLFRETRPGYLRYHGELVCLGYFLSEGKDQEGNIRKLVVFNLAPIETPNETMKDLKKRTKSQTTRAPKKKPESVSVCPKCGNEYSFEDYMKFRFCPDCDTFLSNKIRYE